MLLPSLSNVRDPLLDLEDVAGIVILPDAGQISLCAIEQTNRFLEEVKEQCVPALYERGKPPRISVIIPSHCSGPELGATLLSMIRQTHVFPCEIIVFVNESPDAAAAVRQANDATERWLLSLREGTRRRAALHEYDVAVRAALGRAGDRVRLRCIATRCMEGYRRCTR